MNAEFFMSVVFAGISAGLAAFAVFERRSRKAQWRRMGLDDAGRSARPFVAVLAGVGKTAIRPGFHLCTRRGRDKISSLIVSAGLEDFIDAEGFYAARFPAAILGAVFFFVVSSNPLSLIIGACAGWFYFSVWLGRRAKLRREKISLALPGALDWLALSVEAGLDFAQALSRITEKLKRGALKEEFARLESAIRMGTPRREALSNLAERAGVPALSSFVSLLIQADVLGASIGPVLRTNAKRLREERLARAEKKGVAAAQKALLPLSLCIMPATFIVVFGPLIVRLLTGGFNALF